MRKIIVSAIIATTALSSCEKECPYYMEGKKCENEVRTNYLGTYDGVLTVGNASDNATSVVSVISTEPKHIKIGNLNAELSSKIGFNIPLQDWVLNGTTFQAEGNGSFENTQLKFSIILTYQGEKGAAAFIGNKQ